MGREIAVTLYVVEDEETGEQGVLPDERDFREIGAAIDRDEEYEVERSKGSKGAKAAARAESMTELFARRRWDLEQLRKKNEILKSAAAALTFSVLRPTFGQTEEWEGQATEMDAMTGEARVNMHALMWAMMPACVVEIKGARPETAKEREALLRELDPVVGEALWARLWGMTRPDRTRLFLSLRPSGST